MSARRISYLISLLTIGILILSGCFHQDQRNPSHPLKALAERGPSKENGGAGKVSMRKFPYPYQGMLSITSDIDGTTLEEFVSYHRFLNTKENTPMGRGLGLDVADSFWMFNGTDYTNPVDYNQNGPGAVMTYFQGISNQKKDANLINYYFNKGWIDSMHGLGDFNRRSPRDNIPTRNLAIQAWNALKADGIRPEIWINHGDTANKENFGMNGKGLYSYQKGDVPGSMFYNTDLDIKNGIHFVWNSKSKSQFGYHSILFPIKLRDGQSIWGFYRYAYEPGKDGKFNWGWSPYKIYSELTPQHLNHLVENHQYAVVAQHLGGGIDPQPFTKQNVSALQLLTSYYDSGKILVARTSRLLHYNLTQQYIQYQIKAAKNETRVIFQSIADPVFGTRPVTFNDLRGITIYAEYPHQLKFYMKNQAINEEDIQINPPDSTGKRSVSIKWYPVDRTDYSLTAPN